MSSGTWYVADNGVFYAEVWHPEVSVEVIRLLAGKNAKFWAAHEKLDNEYRLTMGKVPRRSVIGARRMLGTVLDAGEES